MMSVSSKEFDKVLNFWRSQEKDNSPLSCTYFGRKTPKKSHIPQQQFGPQLNTNNNDTLQPDEQNNSSSSDGEHERESLDIPSMIRKLEAQISCASQVSSSGSWFSQATEVENATGINCADKEAESNGLELEEKQSLSSSFSNEKVGQEFFDDDSVDPEEVVLRSDTKINDLDSDAELDNPEKVVLRSDSTIRGSDSTQSENHDENDFYSSSSESGTKYLIRDKETSSLSVNKENRYSEENIFDDDWISERNHIFVLSFAGKPIFSLQRHGYEDKMGNLFALIQCLMDNFELRKDGISSIEAEGVKVVFLVRNALYLAAISRDLISTHHLRLQLIEVYNRIGFLMTFEKLNYIFKNYPGYDLRSLLYGKYNLISNQLNAKKKVSNSIFTLFTNTVRVLPLHPTLRTITSRVIQKKCSKISNLAFALLVVEDQLVALVRLGNNTIRSLDIRLILNLMECSETMFNSFNLWILPICIPSFNKDKYLHAYISCVSEEYEAFLILLAYDRNNFEKLAKAHREINAHLQAHNWFNTVCQKFKTAPLEAYGFNTQAIQLPKLWHFMFIPKSSNDQMLCSKIIPPYTCLFEFERLEAIYRDLHHRIHNNTRPSQLIFEVKEKEVAVALETETVEIYAVFDPTVNTTAVASHYIDELFRWITFDQKAYFIPDYPKFECSLRDCFIFKKNAYRE